MRLSRIEVRGFRNLADGAWELAAEGAAILGPNGHGKTSLLEAICYPVLFRSFRGSPDAEVARFGGAGFQVIAETDADRLAVSWHRDERRKLITVNGTTPARLADAVGYWLAVAFRPDDVALAAGSAAERRLFLDRMLALSDRGYLRSLARYRSALAQRNRALRARRADMAELFEAHLARHGAPLVRARQRWVDERSAAFGEELRALGEPADASLAYAGRAELADAEGWTEPLAAHRDRDLARGTTSIGPHRDDLVLTLGGKRAREFGSSGQQRTAAIALKLLELDTLAEATGRQPALLLDDVFAELDGARQDRLASRITAGAASQIFLTAPRAGELPDTLPRSLGLPVWSIKDGVVTHEQA